MRRCFLRPVRAVVAMVLLLIIPASLFSRGKRDEEAAEPINPEWVLCVTAFDISGLPPGQQGVGDVIIRNLVSSLGEVAGRTRDEVESVYYVESTWAKNRAEAGKKLAAKRQERDALLFKGEANWKYRKELKKIDTAILELEAEYAAALEGRPELVDRPLFLLSEENLKGNFPATPVPGGEYRFCKDQKADAFISGAISEYYGRTVIEIRMYTVYSKSFSHEDRIIFSPENRMAAVDELAERLNAAVSGTSLGALAVYAEPADAVITVNEFIAGTGETGELELPQGTVSLQVYRENYRTEAFEVDIIPGELARLYINLTPLALRTLDVSVPDMNAVSVYLGSLYMGEAPLTLTLPESGFNSIQLEGPAGETASLIIDGSERNIRITPKMPPEEGRVEKYRRAFYRSYGRFWIALPVSMIMSGLYTADLNAYNNNPTEDMYKRSLTKYYVNLSFWILTGIMGAEWVFKMVRYIYHSNTGSVQEAR